MADNNDFNMSECKVVFLKDMLNASDFNMTCQASGILFHLMSLTGFNC